MALSFTQKHVKRMAEVLDTEGYADAEEAARAALECALAIICERAKFTVVSQLAKSGNEVLQPNDPRAAKTALGWYATEKQAYEHALSMYYSTATHEESRSWVLPIFNGTPAAYFKERQDAAKQLLVADMQPREREIQERMQWVKEHPGQPHPPEWGLMPVEPEDTE